MHKFLYVIIITLCLVLPVNASLLSCTYEKDLGNGLNDKVTFYRHDGQSILKINRSNKEQYIHPISRETKLNSGINIVNKKDKIILSLNQIKGIIIEEGNKLPYNGKGLYFPTGYVSYQEYNKKSNIFRHVRAVIQVKRNKDKSIKWYTNNELVF